MTRTLCFVLGVRGNLWEVVSKPMGKRSAFYGSDSLAEGPLMSVLLSAGCTSESPRLLLKLIHAQLPLRTK